MAALLENLDAFTTAATMAQVLPVLYGRSYLDIASMRCQEELGRSRGGVGSRGGSGMVLARTTVVAWSPSVPWWLPSHRHTDAHQRQATD